MIVEWTDPLRSPLVRYMAGGHPPKLREAVSFRQNEPSILGIFWTVNLKTDKHENLISYKVFWKK
jgi:hypothetical protein